MNQGFLTEHVLGGKIETLAPHSTCRKARVGLFYAGFLEATECAHDAFQHYVNTTLRFFGLRKASCEVLISAVN